MGRMLVVFLMAACDSGSSAVVDAPPVDAPPLPLELDVEIMQATSAFVFVHTGGTDRPCGCAKLETDWTFPKVGTCVGYNDVGECYGCASCLRAELVGSGIQQEAVPDDAGIQFGDLPVPLPADLVLRVSGCGHPAFEIPLQPEQPPVPMLDIQVDEPDVVVRWTTDRPAPTALVGIGRLLGGSACHVDANEYTFKGVIEPNTPTNANVFVKPFLPVLVQPTPAGEARVWRGGATYTPLQPSSVR